MQKNMIAIIFHVESEAYQAFYELKKNRENFEISFIRLIQKKLDSYESIEEFKDEDVDIELSDIENLINRRQGFTKWVRAGLRGGRRAEWR